MGNGTHMDPTDFWELKPSLLICPSLIKKQLVSTCVLNINEFGYDMVYNEYMNYIHFISWTEN